MDENQELRTRFEKEAVPYLREIYAFAQRLTRNHARAEDLAQETFLRAFRFFHRYRPGSNLRAWLYKICRNTFINQYHREQRRKDRIDFDAIEGSYETLLEASDLLERRNPEEALWQTLMTEEVGRCMEELPEEYRSAVHLVLVNGFTYREAAEVLDVPLGTIMSRLHRGRKALQTMLLDYAHDARLEAAATVERAQPPAARQEPRRAAPSPGPTFGTAPSLCPAP